MLYPCTLNIVYWQQHIMCLLAFCLCPTIRHIILYCLRCFCKICITYSRQCIVFMFFLQQPCIVDYFICVPQPNFLETNAWVFICLITISEISLVLYQPWCLLIWHLFPLVISLYLIYHFIDISILCTFQCFVYVLL